MYIYIIYIYIFFFFDLSIIFYLINFRYCNKENISPNEIYRANIFRINQLTTNSQCNSNICEYMAWNPTNVDPPAFHEPTKFGFLLLQF